MGLYQVIKFDGAPNKQWIMYKYPGKEFLNNSTLIVGAGQVAIAVHGGKIENLFTSGTYKLSTENFPFLRGLVKMVHGGDVPFTMEIYYFNTTVAMKNVWGTQAPIPMIDPKYGIKVRVRANGQYALQLKDHQLFFSALMGTAGDRVLYDFNDINGWFRGIINTKITVVLGEYIIKNRVSFLDISLCLDDASRSAKEGIAEEFGKYGLELVNFYFSSINVPEEDLAKISDALNRRAEMEIIGDERYKVVRSFDVMEKAASNESGAGAIAAAGIGLGMGMGMAPVVGQTVGHAVLPSEYCRTCRRELPKDAMFCPYCGTPRQRICGNCGRDIPNDIAFCPYCGTKLS